jgi:hypothetical protein
VNVEERARQRRRAAAERYRPERIDTLLVAEAPPSALERFFYFEDVHEHDALFRNVVEVALGEKPTREKTPYLQELKQRGYFLIDLSEDPITSRRDELPPLVPGLVRRCQALAPRRIVLIAVGVYDFAFTTLREAGLTVVDARIPFPGYGQRYRFLNAFAEALGLAHRGDNGVTDLPRRAHG